MNPTGRKIVCEWCDEEVEGEPRSATIREADDEGYLVTYNVLCPKCFDACVDQGIVL